MAPRHTGAIGPESASGSRVDRRLRCFGGVCFSESIFVALFLFRGYPVDRWFHVTVCSRVIAEPVSHVTFEAEAQKDFREIPFVFDFTSKMYSAIYPRLCSFLSHEHLR